MHFWKPSISKNRILVNNYSIYSTDIKPKGFDVVEMEDFITDETVAEVKKILNDSEYRERMVEKNYRIAKCFYSYSVLEERLLNLMSRFWGFQQELRIRYSKISIKFCSFCKTYLFSKFLLTT